MNNFVIKKMNLHGLANCSKLHKIPQYITFSLFWKNNDFFRFTL